MKITNEQPEKRRIGFKIAIWLTILVFTGGIGYCVYNNLEQHPMLIVSLTSSINETHNTPIITNVTFEQSQTFIKGTNSVIKFPEINIMVRNSSLLSIPVSYWTSTYWNQGEIKGEYVLNVFFKEEYIPQLGDILILTIKQIDTKGITINKQTVFYVWK